MKRDKEGHYIMIKVSTQEEDRTSINIYTPNIGAPQNRTHLQSSSGDADTENPKPVLFDNLEGSGGEGRGKEV